MSIETSYGFRSAQAAWENATPYDSDCDCDPLFQCTRCEEYADEVGPCKECKDEDYEPQEGIGFCTQVEREDSTHNAKSSCPQHGYCTGCTSRNCEDCGGDYEPDYDD